MNNSETSVLAVQSYHGKYWGFPQGKINQGESFFDCARRETKEEVGIDINSLNIKERVLKIEAKCNYYYFLCSKAPDDFKFIT